MKLNTSYINEDLEACVVKERERIPTRVLHVYRTYFPDTQGGLEETIRQICRYSVQEGMEVRIFTLSSNSTPNIVYREEAEVHRFPLTLELASCSMSLTALGGFKDLVDWADIVHYHFPWPFEDILHIIGNVNKPSLLTYHSDIIRQKKLLKLYKPLMHKFLTDVDHIVATSQNYFGTSSILGKYSEKVEIIPIGLDEKSYPIVDNSKESELIDKLGENYFIFVGVLRYYKGLHILLDAVDGRDLNVVIVGSGPVEKELKKHASRRNIRNVTFLGKVSDAEKTILLRSSRAIVFPSYLRSEAFGVTLLEGAMLGKPLISTEIGTGTSYININNETGLVIPPGDAKSLRVAMEKLKEDKQLANKMGLAARKRYEELFTAKQMGSQYHKLYKKMFNNNSRVKKN